MISLFDASEEGREFLRVILSSAWDVVEDWFESDYMKVVLARYASEIMIGPKEKGTGNAMFMFSAMHQRMNAAVALATVQTLQSQSRAGDAAIRQGLEMFGSFAIDPVVTGV
jgi:folylpolyglutamate synthase/dihydropteroate synthase